MEIKGILDKPYTDLERLKFITENKGCSFREEKDELQAWGYTDKELAEKEKQEKLATLKITKRNFFLYVAKQFNIKYCDMVDKIKEDDTLYACYDGCDYIFKHDKELTSSLKSVVSSLSSNFNNKKFDNLLDNAFEEHNVI